MGGGVKLQQCRHALSSRSPFVKRMDDARAETKCQGMHGVCPQPPASTVAVLGFEP